MPAVRLKVGTGLLALTVLACTTCIVCAPLRHGHVVHGEYAPNHTGDFDFSDPPCALPARPAAEADDLVLRYLGASSIYVEWRGVSILTAPFFTNYGPLAVEFGDVKWDDQAIREGLAGLPLERTGAIIVGHSHYDHLADLPPILREYAPRSRAYVNTSGVNMLSAFEELEERLVDLGTEQAWIRLRDADGVELPFSILPIPSEHAAQFGTYHYADGEVNRPWDSWDDAPLHSMKEGRSYTFLIDLLDESGETAFRLFYQDAVATPPLGFPSREEMDRRPADVAIVCVPPFWITTGYPEGVLERLRARHVIATHYEDFMRQRDEPLRFVATLTDARANQFLRNVAREMARPIHQPSGPDPCGCGPCGEAWSMPLPGEWLRFGRPQGR